MPTPHARAHAAALERRLLPPLAWKVWKLFEDQPRIGTRELRRRTGEKAGRLDAVLVSLQRSFDLTLSGREYRTDREGKPYGWPSNAYSRVEEWVPSDWWGDGRGPSRREASAVLLETAAAFGTELDLGRLASLWDLRA